MKPLPEVPMGRLGLADTFTPSECGRAICEPWSVNILGRVTTPREKPRPISMKR